MPTISVIVPVYNTEKYIYRCIDSILAQTFTDFELILVDDGSTDNCGAICDEYAAKDSRVRVIHQENGGRSAARNTGIEWALVKSDSEWISFVDSDDWVHPQFLELLLQAAKDNNVEISACKFVEVKEDKPFNQIPQTSVTVVSTENVYTRGGKGIYAYLWDKLYRKKLWESVRFPLGRDWEDTATIFKVLLAVPLAAFVDAECYYYLINDSGIVYSAWTPKKLDHFWAIREALSDARITSRPNLVKLFRKELLSVYAEQLGQINSSKKIDARETKKYSRQLRREFRSAILKYSRRLDLTKEEKRWYCGIAFPEFSWIYWTMRGIFRKSKKVWKK